MQNRSRTTRTARGARASTALTTGALLALGLLAPVGTATATTGAGTTGAPGPTGTPTSASQAAVTPVDWGTCEAPDLPEVPATYACATYDVPLDHADPAGPTVELALIRRPADDPDARQGSLFVNFGGPGGDAVTTVALAGSSSTTRP